MLQHGLSEAIKKVIRNQDDNVQDKKLFLDKIFSKKVVSFVFFISFFVENRLKKRAPRKDTVKSFTPKNLSRKGKNKSKV